MADVELLGAILQYSLLFVVAASGTYLGSYFKKKGENLATHDDIDKLVNQVSAVTAATKQIEEKLSRASRVHERQVDTLIKLYRNFFDAQSNLQRMAASVRFAGEVSTDEYRRLCAEAIAAAHDTLSDGRLLLPPNLTYQCDQFFNSLFEGQMHLAYAQHPAIADGLQRAEFWNKAKTVAYNEVPSILQQIERTARELIHGEPLTT